MSFFFFWHFSWHFPRARHCIQQIGSVPFLPGPCLGRAASAGEFLRSPEPCFMPYPRQAPSHRSPGSHDGSDSLRSLSIAATAEGSGHPPANPKQLTEK